MSVALTAFEREMAGGARGPGAAMAMRILAETASMLGAERLVEITSAHIDGCLHHGDGGVEFAERLAAGSPGVAVPTTLNVGALDLLQRRHVRSDASRAAMARRQMEAYVRLGAEPTFTCAPYQVGHLPPAGAQVAWGESNAIAFVNSVLGARTERYGDFPRRLLRGDGQGAAPRPAHLREPEGQGDRGPLADPRGPQGLRPLPSSARHLAGA